MTKQNKSNKNKQKRNKTNKKYFLLNDIPLIQASYKAIGTEFGWKAD